MNVKIILSLFLLFAVLVQTTFLSFPFFIIFSVLLYILYPELDSILIIFFFSIILDVLQVSTIGTSALFILGVCGLVNVIQKFLNTRDYKTIFAVILISSLFYSVIFSYGINWILYLVTFGGIYLATQLFYGRMTKTKTYG